MKKRTISLVMFAFLFFYVSVFLTDMSSDLNRTNNQYFIDLKISSQNIMLEIFKDLELAFIKAKYLSTDENKDIDAKLNKLTDNYNRSLKSNSCKEMSQCFYNFCYHAELIEYKLNNEIPYAKINEKYQQYISNFYHDLEFVKQMAN